MASGYVTDLAETTYGPNALTEALATRQSAGLIEFMYVSISQSVGPELTTREATTLVCLLWPSCLITWKSTAIATQTTRTQDPHNTAKTSQGRISGHTLPQIQSSSMPCMRSLRVTVDRDHSGSTDFRYKTSSWMICRSPLVTTIYCWLMWQVEEDMICSISSASSLSTLAGTF